MMQQPIQKKTAASTQHHHPKDFPEFPVSKCFSFIPIIEPITIKISNKHPMGILHVCTVADRRSTYMATSS
jgi:hypothetical protein